MSQDNQNSQPPSSPEPEANQPPQEPYQRIQPIWKSKIIQILRGTIGVLEATVEKLETAPPPGTEDKPSFFQQLQLKWGGLLRTIRLFLPSNLSTKLSDTGLTAIVAVVAVVIVWTTATVFSSKPVEVATAPPVKEVPAPTPTITTPPESAVPEPQPPEEITPPSEPETPPSPPEPQLEPIPSPTPTPTLELTPEQTLIAAIENQVAEISDRFASGLIKSIQANFRTSNLTLKISNDWYTLEESQQNKLAAEILQRSQELDFTHLEILDSQNRLIARNPVVGTEMVIFKRQTTS
ncbi:hypothetical protein [Nostoc sp. MG11]|uniref:hypothetical protein n=1 Tax=Nostoc sp. MG11 TaxID=2721166 RepID=UPI0018684F94|nr:hypothetical protein [Nostoc sp. MG11]